MLVEANLAAQAKLMKTMRGLKRGPLKAKAQRRMLALKTDLIALNVEMRLRIQQDSRFLAGISWGGTEAT